MVAIVLKTGGNGRNVNKYVRLDNLKSVIEHCHSQTFHFNA